MVLELFVKMFPTHFNYLVFILLQKKCELLEYFIPVPGMLGAKFITCGHDGSWEDVLNINEILFGDFKI